MGKLAAFNMQLMGEDALNGPMEAAGLVSIVMYGQAQELYHKITE